MKQRWNIPWMIQFGEGMSSMVTYWGQYIVKSWHEFASLQFNDSWLEDCPSISVWWHDVVESQLISQFDTSSVGHWMIACVRLFKCRPLIKQSENIGHWIFDFKHEFSSIQLILQIWFSLQLIFDAKHDDGSMQFIIHSSSICSQPIMVSRQSSSKQSITSETAVWGWQKIEIQYIFGTNVIHYKPSWIRSNIPQVTMWKLDSFFNLNKKLQLIHRTLSVIVHETKPKINKSFRISNQLFYSSNF